MAMYDTSALRRAEQLALEFLEGLARRPVAPRASAADLRAALGGPLPEHGTDAVKVIERMARAADAGLVASPGSRYFGFVIGGHLPAALAADWLVRAWDQNAGRYVMSPAASVVEEVVASWLLEILGLPSTASVGFVTGAQMANFTGLAAARHEVLRRAGWDVEVDGLIGAPPVRVILGEEAHVTILTALKMLGLGTRAQRAGADDQGRMRPEEVERLLDGSSGPTIVCAQAGNVNSGAFDPLGPIIDAAHARGAWVHVDGAFGLWAAASPRLRGLVEGLAGADSWAVDAHKWLNVPQDSGIAIVAHPEAHRSAMAFDAPYLAREQESVRDPSDWVPEASRCARGFAIYAALQSLGRSGLGSLIERCCGLASQMAARLSAATGISLLNEVVLNQVLIGFTPPGGGDADDYTARVIRRVQAGGVCWLGGTIWRGRRAMRISVSNWSTTPADIEASAEAILQAARAEAAPPGGRGA